MALASRGGEAARPVDSTRVRVRKRPSLERGHRQAVSSCKRLQKAQAMEQADAIREGGSVMGQAVE
jgi:hypothetical protein